jgi:hypothetical protein
LLVVVAFPLRFCPVRIIIIIIIITPAHHARNKTNNEGEGGGWRYIYRTTPLVSFSSSFNSNCSCFLYLSLLFFPWTASMPCCVVCCVCGSHVCVCVCVCVWLSVSSPHLPNKQKYIIGWSSRMKKKKKIHKDIWLDLFVGWVMMCTELLIFTWYWTAVSQGWAVFPVGK